MAPDSGVLALRRFLPSDAASIRTWPRSAAEAQWWAGANTRWPVAAKQFQNWHADPDVHPYVFCDGTLPIGYGELWLDADEREAELARLIVAPEFRGRGLGRALVRALLDTAKRSTYPCAFLRVVPTNQAAIACYHHAGFVPVAPDEQASFNRGQPIDYLWMYYLLD